MKSDLLRTIEEIKQQADSDLDSAMDVQSADKCRIKYLGKKGVVTAMLKSLKDIPSADRPEVGQRINILKNSLLERIDKKISFLKSSGLAKKMASDRIDVTLPGRTAGLGHVHPLRRVSDEIVKVFSSLGFSVYVGPEIETDYYNFQALNVPPDHPARDMQDTFYLDDGFLLRTHTSPLQIHVMENEKPPITAVFPGAVYRRDDDLSHSPMFHQVEGLMVGRDITMGHLKGVLSAFCDGIFGKGIGIRFRPSFFPFTEPSAEMDIRCVLCDGKGCRVCKQSGWVEILGCGMVDPTVFKSVGIDHREFSGFAFGMGVERIAMLKYSINDIRLFYENDMRFLKQF